MSLSFIRDTDEVYVDKVLFDGKRSKFIVVDNTKMRIEFDYALGKDALYGTKESQFQLFLFHKDDFATNDIFQTFLQGNRIGWLFPLQALLSDQHDFAENGHFFPYCFNAYKILLKNKPKFPFKQVSTDHASLENIYGENTFIFIVFKKYIENIRKQKGVQFSIYNYILFFHQYGFTLLDTENFQNLVGYRAPVKNIALPEDKKIHLVPISNSISSSKEYVNSLMGGLVKLEKHPLVKFHLLYSIIELLISKIFESDFKKSLEELLSGADFYESKEKLTRIANEKSRIEKLFNSNCPSINQQLLEEIRVECNLFLQFINNGIAPHSTAHQSLYKVRSMLFHNLHVIPSNYDTELEKIVQTMTILILDICLKIQL